MSKITLTNNQDTTKDALIDTIKSMFGNDYLHSVYSVDKSSNMHLTIICKNIFAIREYYYIISRLGCITGNSIKTKGV